jgi:hypothetical protein
MDTNKPGQPKQPTVWSALAAEAVAGRLSLDPSVAADCAAACDELIGTLQKVSSDLGGANFWLNLGDFKSGNDLANAYHRLLRPSSAARRHSQ